MHGYLQSLLNNNVNIMFKYLTKFFYNQHCRFQKLYITKDVSCVELLDESRSQKLKHLNNFIFIILNVRLEVNGIYMLEDCFSLTSFNYNKHWLTKYDWTLLLQLYGFFQVYANLLHGHVCKCAKQMKYKYLREWTEMAFKHKPSCYSILKIYLFFTNLSSAFSSLLLKL